MATVRRRAWKTPTGESRTGYEVTWKSPTGKRQRKLFTGRDAKKLATDHLARVLTDRPAPAGGATVADVGRAWVAHVRDDLKRERTTWEGYERHLRLHLEPAEIRRQGQPAQFGKLAVSSLTGPDCAALRDGLLKDKGAKLASRLMRDVRMLLNFAAERGLVAGNAAAAVKVKEIDRGEDRVEIPEKPELRALLEAVRSPEPGPPGFAEVWIRVGMLTGLRPSEMRGLAIEDLTLDGPSPGLQVRRRADEWQRLGPVKTKAGRRWVPLGPATVALLRRWLLVVPRQLMRRDPALRRQVPVGPSGVADPDRPGRRIHLVFPTQDATVQSLSNIFNRAWCPACEAAGLTEAVPVLDEQGQQVWQDGAPVMRPAPRYTMNCLRHVAASLLIDQGLNAKQLAGRMGHSSVRITLDLYGHLFTEAEADSSAAIAIENDLLGGRRR